jgi:hypothetical protein
VFYRALSSKFVAAISTIAKDDNDNIKSDGQELEVHIVLKLFKKRILLIT